jgi:hypothetical protein
MAATDAGRHRPHDAGGLRPGRGGLVDGWVRRAVIGDLALATTWCAPIVGESIVVNRDLAGRPRAFYNACPSRTQLVDGSDRGHVNKVSAPLSRLVYDPEAGWSARQRPRGRRFDHGDHPLHAIAADSTRLRVRLAGRGATAAHRLAQGQRQTITDFGRYRMEELRPAPGSSTRSRRTGRRWSSCNGACTA